MAAKTVQMSEAPANIDVVNLQISLPQLLDLALGAPEIGAVNFNILHNFLHILLHQINLQAIQVEYRGENADRIKRIVTSLKPSPALQLHEYSIIAAPGEVSQRIQRDADVLTEVKNTLPSADNDLTAAEEKEEAEVTTAEEKEEAEVTTAEEKEEAEVITAEEKEEVEVAAAEIAVTNDVIAPRREDEYKAKEISEPVVDKIRKDNDKLASQPLLNDNAIAEIHQDVATLETDVARIQQELQDLNERVAQREIVEAPSIEERLVVRKPIKDKEKIMEVSDAANLEQCLEAVKNVETAHSKALHDVTQRVAALETEIEQLLERVDSIQADKIADINELVAKVQGIETDVEKIGQAMAALLDEKEKQEMNINTLLNQIELLNTVKANKEDLEDALADKADAQTVNRKVSHDQFDAACDDLARGLEEAIDKLSKQESIWQQALDEVQNEIATKMDKIEMTPLKDFVNNKLKSLQEKLKIMVEARREIEAAGTKKLLRDVQCISCDKDVVMKMEEVDRFRTEPLPCTISIKPYLTYKLDQVRKQQKRLPHSRNMIQFEAAMQEETKKKAREEMVARTPRDHLFNRYCGGSHTVTTPQQRVMRMGHFLTQWGPETIQLTDGLIRGKDGQMYRSRPMPDKSDVCGPACWENQISEETGPSECASTPLRKSLSSRRNSAGNQITEKQNSRKEHLKEPSTSEPEEKTTIEAHQVTSPQENNDRPPLIPAKLQDEIMLDENNEVK